MQIVDPSALNAPQEAALRKLQNAIERLATKSSSQLALDHRQRHKGLVADALEAYRGYMEVVKDTRDSYP